MWFGWSEVHYGKRFRVCLKRKLTFTPQAPGTILALECGIVYYTRLVRSSLLAHLINPLTYLRGRASFTPGWCSTDCLLFLCFGFQTYINLAENYNSKSNHWVFVILWLLKCCNHPDWCRAILNLEVIIVHHYNLSDSFESNAVKKKKKLITIINLYWLYIMSDLPSFLHSIQASFLSFPFVPSFLSSFIPGTGYSYTPLIIMTIIIPHYYTIHTQLKAKENKLCSSSDWCCKIQQ